MSSSITTMERTAVGMAVGGSWLKQTPPAVTLQSVRRRQFRLTEELLVEIELEGAEPKWLVDWMERIAQLLNLQDNWDSYGAIRIKPSAVFGAISLVLPSIQYLSTAPIVMPHRSGGVQLEWHAPETELEILALSEHQYRLSYSKNGVEIADDLMTRDPHFAARALRDLALP